MLIAPGFVPEGGGIDWGNVTASSLLGLEPGAAVVEGQVILASSFVSGLQVYSHCHVRCQDRIANSHFSLSQFVPGGPRAVWRSHPPGGEASTSWGQVSKLLRMFCMDSTCHSHGIVSLLGNKESTLISSGRVVMHTHTPYATALGCLQDPSLLMIHQNSCR